MKTAKTTQATKKPSLHDVAQLAGVSAAAVSYVVNGRTGEVGAETLVRIQSAIATLRYQPQRRGLSLKFNREFAIGFVIVDPDPSFLADPFTTQVASGLSNALVEPGYGVTITGCRSIGDLDSLLKRPIGVDAYVVISSGPKEEREHIYAMLHQTNLPLVIIQEDAPAALRDACAVLQDDYAGAWTLADHLIERGVKSIMWVAPSRIWPAIERREQGLRAAVEGRATFSRVECDEQDFGGSVATISAALNKKAVPDAIMGANDQIAIAALAALRQRGTSVPGEVQVTGYNDFVFRNYSSPLLTTVVSPASEIGRRAAGAVLSRLDAGHFPERKIELAVILDAGETTLPA
ncbi:LacI family DNA-binding transcriptional regulator [Pararhizobium sp.]|uniref:LacI family DNA-binding transcriptional regulator n=1 Tax=Pararhizobium sp. TaxID=1977563 RepID=UPI00271EFF27|nr:LacI family DNA-binding transcriptional regulator [Pararhizobium sp.]MDO9418050.1 LacI family DNA-binding transcriptional regulator [Pararhizobium sp.]